MNLITPAQEQKYFERAKTFEDCQLEQAEGLIRKLWYALLGAGTIICLLLAVVFIVLATRQVYPFLITQYKDDRLEVTDLISNPKKTYDEVMNEYWVRLYVANRENWNYSQGQSMFDTTQLLNSPAQQTAYRTESDPNNKDSKTKKYGQNADVTLRENSPPVPVDYKKDTGLHIITYRWTRVVTSRVDNRPPEMTKAMLIKSSDS
jgi:type IV secretory pathway component VirB8